MSNYKEIVTKAVVGKGKTSSITEHVLTPSSTPTTILGCWVINHKFTGNKVNDTATINGTFDINIWYSKEKNTKTEVVTETVNYTETVALKSVDDEYDGTDEIIIRATKQPNCIKAEIKDGIIYYSIEKELSVEVVGDAKIRVGINDEDDDSNTVEEEIEDNVKEDFLG